MLSKKGHLPVLIAFLLALLSCRSESEVRSGEASPAKPPERKVIPLDPVHNEIAKFLSGLPSEAESYRALREDPVWKEYAQGIETNWAYVEENRLKLMTTWAAAELAEPHASSATLFYPFGGPDFITAFHFFPNAETYVLLGLEAVGNMPAILPMTSAQMGKYLGLMNSALADFFKRSYFITGHMDESLPQLDGVLPVISLFLAKSGNSIVAIRRVEVTPDGGLLETPYPSTDPQAGRPKGIRIDFLTEGTDKVRTLYYFSWDLEDKVFGPESPLYRYLDKLAGVTTFIKSASYLLHYQTFSRIRDIILAKSRYILEDDTGIPYRFFKKGWSVQLYGVYDKPIKDFSGVDQKDLMAAYQNPAAVKTLPFNLGYHWRSKKDNLLFIRREDAASGGPRRPIP